MKNAEQTGGLIKSVDKAMQLIELILRKHRPMSLQELSTCLGYPKSTIHAILATLREHSVIEQRPDGKYYLGIRLFECGCAVSAEWNISQIVHPHLVKLAEQTGASAFVSMLDGNASIVFDRHVPSSGSSLQILQEPGSRHPLHATAQGKLLLSALEEADTASRLAACGMPSYTRHTITDPDAFLKELALIRTRGYAIEDGEYKVGLRSIAAPVYDRDGKIKYALGVVGLFNHISSEEFQYAIQQTTFQARQISLAIGYRE